MPEYFQTLEELQQSCSFVVMAENYLANRFDPNPWIFDGAYRPNPNEQRYVIRYRNFDRSQHVLLTASHKDGSTQIHLAESQ